jgi:hypothetical protein
MPAPNPGAGPGEIGRLAVQLERSIAVKAYREAAVITERLSALATEENYADVVKILKKARTAALLHRSLIASRLAYLDRSATYSRLFNEGRHVGSF